MERRQQSVSEVTSKLQCVEDYNYALKLQEEEFTNHFASNRAQRRLMANDIQRSRHEQDKEDINAREVQRMHNFHLTLTDEEIARQLQEEFERDNALLRSRQLEHDVELAKKLQREEELRSTSHRLENLRLDEERSREFQTKIDVKENPAPKDTRTIKQMLSPIISNFGGTREKATSERKNQKVSLRKWDELIDFGTQNELNSQIAGIGNQSKRTTFSTYTCAAKNSGAPIKQHNCPPLATIATRDDIRSSNSTSHFDSTSVCTNYGQTVSGSASSRNAGNSPNDIVIADTTPISSIRQDSIFISNQSEASKIPNNDLISIDEPCSSRSNLSNFHPTNPFLQFLDSPPENVTNNQVEKIN